MTKRDGETTLASSSARRHGLTYDHDQRSWCRGVGVGGIEAEAVMLGQPDGHAFAGCHRSGCMANCVMVLQRPIWFSPSRKCSARMGVVDKFVEFFGEGLNSMSLTDRATIANMAPEYGATIGYFPVDEETLRYLRCQTPVRRSSGAHGSLHTSQGLFRDESAPHEFTDTPELDLASVVPSLAAQAPAGPRALSDMKAVFESLHGPDHRTRIRTFS